MRDRGRARRRQGRARREAARALRGRRSRRASLRGDRDPPGSRPRDRDPRPLRGRGSRMEQMSAENAPRMDERGLVELDDSVPKTAKIDGESAVIDAAGLTARKITAERRWLIYEQGIKDVTVLNPSARHSLGVAILARCRIRFEGSLGYFGCGLIDGPEVEITGRVGWSVAENMMS